MSIDRRKYLNQDEIKQIRDAAQKMRSVDWMLVDLALGTGLRVCELAALTVEDVDLTRSCITVKRRKKRKVVTESMAIGDDLKQHLGFYIVENELYRGPLLLGLRGPLTTSGLQQIWHKCRTAAGLPKWMSIHCARHSVAVQILRKTGNLRMAQIQLGHSSPITTANMYGDVRFEDMQSTMSDLWKD